MTLPRAGSVNREPIVYNDNEPTRVQTCDNDTSLFLAKPASGKGPVLEKRGSQKGLVMLGGACWSQGSYSNSAREISRALFARGGVGRHVVLSVCYTKLS